MPLEEATHPVRRGSSCIHETFLRQAARSPHAVAVVDRDRRLTYREIDARSNQLAHHLRGLGVGRETLVGICLERSAELVIAILGILKAGAAYLPLDPSHAPQRLSFYLSDARASALVSSRSIARSWPEGLPIVRLDEHAAALQTEPESPPEPLGAPDDLAYVIYTSGSTGTPKGVMVTHHNVSRLFRSSEHLFRFDDRDVWALFHSYAFDFSVWEILGALLYGGRVVIVPADDCRALHRFARLLKDQGVTVLCQTPSAFRQLSPHIVADPEGIALRYVIFGGEALELAALRPWIECFGEERPQLVNMYGITETTVVNTYRRVRRADLAGTPSVIGEPFPDTELLLLDSNLEPVPIGETGEIFLSGDCLARGYLNRPELTAERYIHWPRDGRRLYRSGDLARRLPDGEIEYLGRIDDQVKIRGFRIELGEITTHLLAYPGVSDAAVVVLGEGSDKRLVAYVVPKPGQTLVAHDLQGALSQKLSDYMVPSAIVFLDRLPLTVNGKLDRAALPLPNARSSSFRAPESRVEHVMTRLFSEALGVPEVGLDDDFLALGGNSLMATQLLWALEKELGVKLPFRALLGASTVAALAREVESAQPTNAEAARPFEPLPRDQFLPLSHAQERIWLHARSTAFAFTYNETVSIHVRAALDEAALRAAMQRLVQRHEALRMTFVEVDGEPRKRAHPQGHFGWLTKDLRDVPAEKREAEALRIAADVAREPFDLSAGPLLRTTVLRLGDADYRIFWTFHHIALDGMAIIVLFSDLEAEYTAVLAGAAPLPPLALQEADACAMQRAALAAARERDLPYWREKLADLPELDLPTDRPRPPVQSFRGASFVHVLPRALVARVRAAAAQWGATPYQICLSAFVAMLQRLAQKDEVVLGTLTGGRTHAGDQSIVGCFVNAAVLRISMAGVSTFRDLVARVRDIAAEAYDHHALPFHEVVAALKPARDPGKHPLFQVAFATEAPAQPSKLGWELRFMFEVDKGTSRFDLIYELAECGEDQWLSVEYSTDLFDADTMSRMVERYLLLLDGALEEQAAALATLPIVTPEEREVLTRFSGTDAPFPRNACIHHLVEAEALRAPDAVATVFEGQSLTYEELDARANQLAHHLRSLGVGLEARVGLCVQRSPSWLVAILGIWKAGGAYVPLDPAYPRARLAFMVEDAKAEILVADRPSLAALSDHGARVVLLDDHATTIAAKPTERPDVAVRPDNLAYVIYTSGSTGKPKGVLVPHLGLCNLGLALVEMCGIRSTSRVLQFTSPSFDVSVGEIIVALSAGATLVFAPPSSLLPGPSLRRLLRDQRVTAALLTPSALAALDAGREGAEADLLHLETIIAAGEACPPQIVQRWARGRQFVNAYGPTEATIYATWAACVPDGERPPIGRPAPNARCFVLDANMHLVPPGVPGELFIGGVGVARGYLDRPELTAERFVQNPFGEGRLYRTGDRVRFRSDGQLDFLGRMDRQLKLRGFRIEPGEIEAELGRHPAVKLAAVEVVGADDQDKRLVAYVVPREGAMGELEGALKEHLRERLPEHMVPSAVVTIAHMPMGPTGKIDRAALPAPKAPARPRAMATTDVEREIVEVWRDVLGVAEVGIDEPFFEAGGHSLALARVQAKLGARLGVDLDAVTLLRLPTIRTLAAHVAGLAERRRAAEPAPAPAPRPQPIPAQREAIALVGVAIRAPGVRDARSLWDVAREGRETIRALDREALIAAGANPDRVRRPEYVPAEGVLDDADRFDAAFFGYSDADALLMDPQQRIFLEGAHAALEHAGCDPARFSGRIGVFAGTGTPRYWLGPVAEQLRSSGSDFDAYRAQTLNAPDFLATRVAFKLGLRGPAMTVQTACSTSLSAVHLARRSLLAGDCDVALAGGVSLASLGASELGHLHAEAGILSADGHCRAFDAGAGGTVKSSGVAIVALKRLADALADGDTIHAVVLGSAMNNDGGAKVGFTAPSEDGLAEAIEQAYEAAGVDPGSVGFVEAHGTGTRLGDPTEVRALTRAYRRWTEKRGSCALGSLKANLGHLDAAAGAAGLIKAALVLEHAVIPPLAGLRAPNPLLDLPNTPFFVNDAPLPFPAAASPRRAGVSAMGIGGTNVHVVLEEAPRVEAQPSARPHQLLCLSARTPTALAEVARRLRDELADNPALDLADVAHTLSVGRTQQKYRATIVCPGITQALDALAHGPSSAAALPLRADRPVVLLFPGHGAQYAKMGLDLYLAEPAYRAEVNVCLDILRDDAGLDLRPLLVGEAPDAEAKLDEMRWAQPFLFTIEYALAKLLLAWGVRPRAMLGHSLGEYVAACVAGVFSLRDALRLVAIRGRLMDATPAGRMLTVFADERFVAPYLQGGVAIATYAPGCVVLSGPAEAIEAARERLTSASIETSAVRVSRASHSPLMNEIRAAFRAHFARVELRPPTIDVVSNVTGAPLSAEQATDPDYWVEHLCGPVRLDDGMGTLLALGAPICVEIGPGAAMGSFLQAHPRFAGAESDLVATMPGFRKRDESSHAALLRGLGRAWELGVDVDWRAFYGNERRLRVPLPTYPFEGRRYFLGNALAAPREAQPKPRDAQDVRAIELARELGVRPLGEHPGFRSRLEALCGSLVLDFFARMLGPELGRARNVEALRQAAGILPKFASMVETLVDMLVRMELAEKTHDGAFLLRRDMVGRSPALAASLRKDHPTMTGLVRFVEHCVNHYDEALTGLTEPIGVLYPDGTDAFYRECMRDTEPYLHDRVYLELARETVLGILERRKGKTIRILEVGAGHGTLTWPLLERLRDSRVEYYFTDIGRSFLQRAEAEAERRGIGFLKCQRFDLDCDPEEQGLGTEFDIILGYNSVHVARDLSATLLRLHEMLSPGGSLLLVEALRIEVWDHLTWGLAPGYWQAVGARGSLVLGLERWEELLSSAGFVRIAGIPKDPQERAAADHGLLRAERSPTAPPSVRPPSLSKPPPRILLGARAEADCAAELGSLGEIVQSIWKRLLGLPYVPTDRSFFDLGGDSLLAVQMLAELRAKAGLDVKMRQFAANPTVAGIAGVFSGPERRASATVLPPPRRADSCLVPLAQGGSKRPFFCVHPIGGGALCYAPLARAMGSDRPFYGLQSPMLEDPAARPGSIEELAALYLEAIRLVQPEGPYLLGGWSFGGVIAAEMARQLRRRGEIVAELVFFDVILSWRPELAVRIMEDLAGPHRAIMEYHIDLWRRHAPEPLDVPVTHFVAEDGFGIEGGRDVPRVETAVRVPGDHFSMLAGANAIILAARMNVTLDAAEAPRAAEVESGTAEERAIRAYLRQYVEMASRDPRRLVEEFWARTPSPFLFDTIDGAYAGVENIREQHVRQFEAIEAGWLRIHDEHVQVFADGKAACATALLDSDLVLAGSGKHVRYRRVRATWVLESSAAGWRARHVHYSLPVGEALHAKA